MTADRVLLVDDHPIVRAGLRSLFVGRTDVEVVGEAATGEEAIALSQHLHPDVWGKGAQFCLDQPGFRQVRA